MHFELSGHVIHPSLKRWSARRAAQRPNGRMMQAGKAPAEDGEAVVWDLRRTASGRMPAPDRGGGDAAEGDSGADEEDAPLEPAAGAASNAQRDIYEELAMDVDPALVEEFLAEYARADGYRSPAAAAAAGGGASAAGTGRGLLGLGASDGGARVDATGGAASVTSRKSRSQGGTQLVVRRAAWRARARARSRSVRPPRFLLAPARAGGAAAVAAQGLRGAQGRGGGGD